MKLKRVLAGFLAGTLVVTGIPVSGLGVISAEAAVQTDIEANLQYRTRPIAEVEVSTDIGAEFEDDVHPFSNLTLRSGYAKSKRMDSVKPWKGYWQYSFFTRITTKRTIRKIK